VELADRLAALNAVLNATSFVLLCTGYYFIRTKQIQRHRRTMLTAFVISVLFLCSYLTRIALSGTHVYPHEAAYRGLYLFILGTHVPLAIRFPSKTKTHRTVDGFVVLTDLAPTILEAAGLKPPAEMTGRTLMPLLAGDPQPGRERVFLERERHAQVRRGDLGYPVRAIRNKDFLYIRNIEPDRWPAGDPEMYVSVGPFGDIDGGPTKDLLMQRRDDPAIAKYFALATAKRPEEELFDLRKDPQQLDNVAAKREYAAAKSDLRAALLKWMRETHDPRAANSVSPWDRYPYFGPAGRDR